MGTRNWREVRGERPLNEDRVEAYRRLLQEQHRIAEALIAHGVSLERIDAALAASDAADPGEGHDPYWPMLEAYVTTLGGEFIPHGTAPPGTTVWRRDS